LLSESKEEKKPCIQKRLKTWLFNLKPEDKILIMVSVCATFIYFIFFFFYSSAIFFSFLTSWSAGILGILIGFALDRKIEQIKDNRVKRVFLNLVHDELNEIKSAIYPQTKDVCLYSPDIWDSIISSGVIRLFNSEQVNKLSNVYKYAKGHLFEAEWVRRALEECNSVPKIEKEKKEWLEKRLAELWSRYFERGEELNRRIEEILKEKWWN
jgi:hypothetical protein